MSRYWCPACTNNTLKLICGGSDQKCTILSSSRLICRQDRQQSSITWYPKIVPPWRQVGRARKSRRVTTGTPHYRSVQQGRQFDIDAHLHFWWDHLLLLFLLSHSWDPITGQFGGLTSITPSNITFLVLGLSVTKSIYRQKNHFSRAPPLFFSSRPPHLENAT